MSALFLTKLTNYIAKKNNNKGTNKLTMAAMVWTVAQNIYKRTGNKK